MNKATIIGNPGKKTEVKAAPEGSILLSTSVATIIQWKNNNAGGKKTAAHRFNILDGRDKVKIIREA